MHFTVACFQDQGTDSGYRKRGFSGRFGEGFWSGETPLRLPPVAKKARLAAREIYRLFIGLILSNSVFGIFNAQ